MDKTLYELYDVIKSRKDIPVEGSYTCYLFESGIDKILKKVGEECTETIIAAKNSDKEAIVYETSDLIYHLLVMLCERSVDVSLVEEELKKRLIKQQNLKTFKKVDKNT